jgi:hypothetical protein
MLSPLHLPIKRFCLLRCVRAFLPALGELVGKERFIDVVFLSSEIEKLKSGGEPFQLSFSTAAVFRKRGLS